MLSDRGQAARGYNSAVPKTSLLTDKPKPSAKTLRPGRAPAPKAPPKPAQASNGARPVKAASKPRLTEEERREALIAKLREQIEDLQDALAFQLAYAKRTGKGRSWEEIKKDYKARGIL